MGGLREVGGGRLLASALVLAWMAVSARTVASAVREDTVASLETLGVEVVTALYQDRTGFLWIGTREGLIRFDGYTATTFEHDAADPDSLADNAIRVVFEDRKGRIWIGTNTGGLDRFDPRGRFVHHRREPTNPQSLSNDAVYSLAEDADGRLWVGTLSGLNRLDPETGLVERFDSRTGGLPHDYVDAVYEDHTGALWIGTVGGGLACRDPAGTMRLYPLEAAAPAAMPARDALAVREDDAGRLWVSTNRGVFRRDPGSDRFVSVSFDLPGGVTGFAASCLEIEPGGAVWVGTFGDGLWRLDPRDGVFRRHPTPPGRGGRLIVCMLRDDRGRLWAGTWGGGLLREAAGSGPFRIVPLAQAPAEALVPEASVVLEDRSGGLWVGSTGESFLERQGAGRPVRFDDCAPLCLFEAHDGRLWIGASRQLRVYDPATGSVQDHPADGRTGGLGAGWVWAVTEDREGRTWVGTGAGLHRLKPDGTFDRFTNRPSDPLSLSDNYVTTLLADREGALWIGTRAGLNRLPQGGAGFEHFLPSGPGSITSGNVLALFEDRRGTVWVGTGGGGLNRVERGANGSIRFAAVTESDGLADDNVVSIGEDDDGSLWVGTRRGISRYDPATGAIASYGVPDGLPSAGFAVGAVSAGRGELFFGTLHGPVAVPRGTAFPKLRPSPVLLTSVGALKEPTPSDRPPWQLDRIVIPYGEILAVSMAVLDYGDHRQHRYAYRLGGLHEALVELGNRREVTFSRLDPGEYTLRVRGRNDQGVWADAAPLTIRVVPPFWMRNDFRTLVLALIVLAALAAHRLRTTSLQRRNRELMLLKEQRERALEEATATERKLHEAYERLRSLTRKLEAAREDERKIIARELHDELGQAISTAKLSLQLLGSAASPEEGDRRVGEAIALLDQMIGLVRTMSLDLRPPLLDELGLTAALRAYLEAQERRSGVAIELEDHGMPARLPEDLQITLFRVVQESVTNVIRHAAANHVAVRLAAGAGALTVQVSDDGGGFEVDAALARAAQGRHLGLLGMRERVEVMGGSLEVVSSPGRGAAVRAVVPLPLSEPLRAVGA